MSNLAISDQHVSGGLQVRSMDDLGRLSKMMAQSGFFSDARDAAQCGVKILAGLEMGFTAFQAMTGIYIIKGKPSVGANLMASKVRASKKYDYEELEKSDKVCRLAFYETEFKPTIRDLKLKKLNKQLTQQEFEQSIEAIALGISSFTITEAKAAGTQNLDKFPRNMLFARAISNGVKWYCPDIFITPVYTPEELGASVDDEGNIIDASVVPESSPVPQIKAESPYASRIKSLIRMTGLSIDSIKTACNKMDIPSSSSEYTSAEQVDQFMIALFSQWGFEQGCFSVFKHSYNSLVKLTGDNTDKSDEQLWGLWQEKIFSKMNEESDQALNSIQPEAVEVA